MEFKILIFSYLLNRQNRNLKFNVRKSNQHSYYFLFMQVFFFRIKSSILILFVKINNSCQPPSPVIYITVVLVHSSLLFMPLTLDSHDNRVALWCFAKLKCYQVKHFEMTTSKSAPTFCMHYGYIKFCMCSLAIGTVYGRASHWPGRTKEGILASPWLWNKGKNVCWWSVHWSLYNRSTGMLCVCLVTINFLAHQ